MADLKPGERGLAAVWSAVSWFHPLFQRPHHLCIGLARRGYEVVYLEPEERDRPKPPAVEVDGQTIQLFHMTEAAISPGYAQAIDLAQRAMFKTRQIVSPLYQRPDRPRHFGVVRFFHERIRPEIRWRGLAPLVEARLLAGPLRPRFLLLEHPAAGGEQLMRRLQKRGMLGVFDMLDDFQALGGHPSRARIERRLLRQADLVATTAASLEATARGLNPHVVRVPNAATPEHFLAARQRDLPADWPFPGEHAPVVGYAGAIWDWFDVELIAAAARARRDLRFLLVGMAQDGIRERLAAEPNVRLVGARPFAELPRWLSGFDVATIPFVVNEITLATNPVKVYEYLAAGLPVVSADLPEVRGLPQVVTAQDLPSFLAAIDRALAGKPDLASIDRFLAEHTWEKRVDCLLEAVEARRRALHL